MMLSIHKIGFIVLALSSWIDFSLAEPRVVCYYTNWSVYRPGTAKFNPQNINPYLCTHLIYAFGGFTKDNQLKPFDKYQDIEQGGYAKFTGLKTYNKELKTMLAIGGWNEGSTRFSPLVASSDRRSQLVKNTIKFLRQNKFDGLDLDWEYPAFRDGGKSKDRENYAKLVQELREEFQREHDKTGRPRLLLTMAVPAGFEYIEKGYDIPKLNKHLDWFNLLSYDYHSAYEPSVNHHAPLYPIEEENEYSYDTDLNINSTINYYVQAGADREKLVLGIPTYGRSYTLFNSESNEIGAPADGPGDQGDATREKGYLAYYEICQSLKEEDSDWTVVQPNPEALGPYAYSGNQWVGYDDEDIVRKKSKFVVQQNLGGIMFWSIDNDDFRGLCNGKAYPLIEAAKEAYLDSLSNGVPSRTSVSKPKQTKVSTTTKRPESQKSKNTPKYTTPPPPTTPDPGSDFKCEDEGFYAHPRDCKKYFWCLEAAGLGIVAHQFTCPSGLYFNKAADSCDYSRNVHCSKSSSTTSTTTTTTEVPTTVKIATSTRSNPLYKSPSRTTQHTTTQRTTTASYDEPITDPAELDQEDPTVIKELIDLIKKVGGVEELEKQLNLHEEGLAAAANYKNGQKSTTPSSIISQSLYDKIKNRASVLNKRPAFNGASQPERVLDKPEPKAKLPPKPQNESKKYESINRFSRPNPQSSGIENLPESDAVLIERPQYVSIQRKPAKPAVVSENDYNGDVENSSSEETVVSQDSRQKYATINRTRRPPIVQKDDDVDDDDDDDDDDDNEDEIPPPRVQFKETTRPTTTANTNKYVNVSRRRSTTSKPETESIELAPETTTVFFRRRVSTSTQKTVLKDKTNNRNQIERNNQANTVKISQREVLTVNKNILNDDDEFNVIALPTEPVTENVPFPENILTTRTSITTQYPNTTPSSIQVTETFIQTEALNDVIDDGLDQIDPETTTLLNDLNIVEDGISKQSNVNFVEKSNSIEPRPFSRPSLSRTRSPVVNSKIDNSETTKSTTARSRPTRTRSTTESILFDNELESTSRPQYSYHPGYRGSARFRVSTTRSGQYSRTEDNLSLGNYQPIENNRLRALNADKFNTRPSTTSVPSTLEVTKRRLTTRKFPIFSKTTPSPEDIEEQTTEQRIVEAKNHFNLEQGERPERIRFELAVGRKIDFGFTTKSQAKSSDSDSSKVKVITGPLEKSPLVSGREYKKGHVEEIPLTNAQNNASVSIQNFSDKLNLNEIPLNKSDIESFVRDEDLRTESPVDETTRKLRLRPSIIGFTRTQTNELDKKSTQSLEETTTLRTRLRPSKTGILQKSSVETGEKSTEASEETTTSKARLRPSKVGFIPRSETEEKSTEASEETTTSKARLRPSKVGFIPRGENKSNPEEIFVQVIQDTTSRPGFRTRFPARVKSDLEKDESISIDESTTKRVFSRPSGFRSRSTQGTKGPDNIIDLNSNTDATIPRLRSSAFQNRFSQRTRFNINTQPISDSKTEESTTSTLRVRPSPSSLAPKKNFDDVKIEDVNELQTENPLDETTVRKTRYSETDSTNLEDELEENEIDFTTPSHFDLSEDDETTFDSITETTSSTIRSPVIRKRPEKKIDVLATRQTITEASDLGNVKTSSVSTSDAPQVTNTRRRIVFSRTRPKIVEKEVIDDANDEVSGEPQIILSEADDKPLSRKTVKVYRTRSTTEKPIELPVESTKAKVPVTRTRIIKRPLQVEKKQDVDIEASVDEESTSSKYNSSFSRKRKLITVNRKPVSPEGSDRKSENVDSSTSRPKGVYKVLRTKTPKVLVVKPLEEDSPVIKTEDEVQDLGDQNDFNEDDESNSENIDKVSDNVSRPIQNYPTRPNNANRVVTIKRRPSLSSNSKSTTIHPASTRFSKDYLSTRAKKVTRRKFKPSFSKPSSKTDSNDGEAELEPVVLSEKTRQKFSDRTRKPLSTTLAPNITPHETETTEYDDDDTTELPLDNNAENILQKESSTTKPRFSLSRFTTTTTTRPTTLHHVFAIDVEEELNPSRNKSDNKENNADEVIKKLQKLIEINRIVEVYSKEEKLKLLKNKKLKSLKISELTVEKPPSLDKFSEISRETIIKLVKRNSTVDTTTERTRDPKNIDFSETVFGQLESSTISLEGLFEREKKSHEIEPSTNLRLNNQNHLRAPAPFLRPESNETDPIIISLKSLDKVILSKVQKSESDRDEKYTTEVPSDETTIIDDN